MLEADVLRRYDEGEPIAASYASTTYAALFNAVAVGAWDVAIDHAGRMGGRPKLEKEFSHPFDRSLDCALKWFVLDDREQMEASADHFLAECGKRGNSYFMGYAHVFKAILESDLTKANEGMQTLVAGHKRASAGNGVFSQTSNILLCVWGLGMANLCHKRGLPVDAIPPLIPEDLIITA